MISFDRLPFLEFWKRKLPSAGWIEWCYLTTYHLRVISYPKKSVRKGNPLIEIRGHSYSLYSNDANIFMFSTQTWKMGSCIHSSILFIFYILSNLLSCMVQINFNTFFISYKFATRLWKESFIYSFFIFYQIRWAVWFNLILIHFFISYKFATRLWKESCLDTLVQFNYYPFFR